MAVAMECPVCRRQYPVGASYCAEDGHRLEAREATLPTAPAARGLLSVDPLLGRTLDGRYQITARIGAGGMGAVYKARQLNVDRDVAVKVLLGAGLVDRKLVQRFEDEARIISRLRHPGLLKLFDVGWVEEGAPYFVTELLHGQSLHAAVAAAPLDEARALRITHALAEALVEPHAQGIIHRDIKPANVFLEQIGDRELVKLLDFGVAMFQEGGAHTTTGNVLGTPRYMSPEQATGEDLGPASDLYSLGVLLFECLTGRAPFAGTTAAAILLQHVTTPPPAASSLRAVSADVDALVASLLAKSPADRPADARALSRRIEAMLRQREEAAADMRPGDSVAGGARATEAAQLGGAAQATEAAQAGGAASASVVETQSPTAAPLPDTVRLPSTPDESGAPARPRGALAAGFFAALTLAATGWWVTTRGSTPEVQPIPLPAPNAAPDPAPPRAAPSAASAALDPKTSTSAAPVGSSTPMGSTVPVSSSASVGPAPRPSPPPVGSPRAGAPGPRAHRPGPASTPSPAAPSAPPSSPAADAPRPSAPPAAPNPSPTPKVPTGYVPVLTR